MVDRAASDLLRSDAGAAVLGLLTDDGEPWATRCWGVTVLSEEPLRLRLLLPAGSLARIGRVAGSPDRFALALTVANVSSLQAVQAKGTAHSLEAPTPEDQERFEAHCRELLQAINATDGYAPDLLERWPPTDLVASTLDVADVYDQTPGPGAGARLDGMPA